jgi:hypothetical protein
MTCLPTFLPCHRRVKWKISSRFTILYGFKSGCELIWRRNAQNIGQNLGKSSILARVSKKWHGYPLFHLNIVVSNERSRRVLPFHTDWKADANCFSEEILRILGKTVENRRFWLVNRENDMVTHFFMWASSCQMKDLVEIYHSIRIQKWMRTNLVKKCSRYWAEP